MQVVLTRRLVAQWWNKVEMNVFTSALSLLLQTVATPYHHINIFFFTFILANVSSCHQVQHYSWGAIVIFMTSGNSKSWSKFSDNRPPLRVVILRPSDLPPVPESSAERSAGVTLNQRLHSVANNVRNTLHSYYGRMIGRADSSTTNPDRAAILNSVNLLKFKKLNKVKVWGNQEA